MTGTETVTAPDVDQVRPPAASTSDRGPVLRMVAGLLAIVFVALVVVALVEVKRAHTANAKEAAGREAVAAGIKDFPLVASYSYATITADMARAKSVFTPALQKDYAQIFAPLIQTLQQNKVVVATQVQQGQAIGVDSTSSVRVLIFYTQQTSKPTASSPSLAPGTEALTMVKLNGKWLIGAANAAG